MAWTTRGLTLVAAAGAAAVTVRKISRARHRAGWPMPQDGAGGRWHVTTVALPIDKVTPNGRPLQPLAELDDAAEIQIRSAPGDKGTEIAVRAHNGRDSARAVRRALREAKSVLEAGEVLRPDSPPTTERTLLSRPLEYATRHGREEGLL